MLKLTKQQLVLKDKLKKTACKRFLAQVRKRYNTNITALYYNNALDTNYNVITAISRCEILTNSILVV